MRSDRIAGWGIDRLPQPTSWNENRRLNDANSELARRPKNGSQPEQLSLARAARDRDAQALPDARARCDQLEEMRRTREGEMGELRVAAAGAKKEAALSEQAREQVKSELAAALEQNTELQRTNRTLVERLQADPQKAKGEE